MVETRDAMVGMAVAYNDRPLNPEERQGRIWTDRALLDDPANWNASAGRNRKTPNGSSVS